MNSYILSSVILLCTLPFLYCDKVSHINQDLLTAAQSLDDRIGLVLSKVRSSIPGTVDGVESDIASSNRNKVLIGCACFLGKIFGIRKSVDGPLDGPTLTTLSTSEKLNIAAQTLYGYGYWAPFLLTLEEASVDCGLGDFDSVLTEYGFLMDFENNYGYLDDQNNAIDPAVLSYYISEFNHAMKRILYCLVSKKGSNLDARGLNSLIDLLTSLLSQRLELTEAAISRIRK